MSGIGKRTYLREVNPYLICPLCRGYLIDATTVVECLHSFCRSCILKHLNTEAHCPSCKHVLNKAKPNIKADKALQDIVYKLVPGLYHKEMRKRREFYKKHPEHADLATPEQRGEDVSGRLIFAPEDAVSLSLEYLPPGADPMSILLSTNDDTNNSNASNNQNNNSNNGSNNGYSNNANNHSTNTTSRRYLQCPALVTIAHLKKFLASKYNVDMTRYTIEICHRRAPLPEHWTLMDVAYIYAWKRNAPMRFFYRVALEEQRLEAPPHDRPSTPGLGASFPPVDTTIAIQNNINSENPENDIESKSETKSIKDTDEKTTLDNQNEISNEKSRSPSEQISTNETIDNHKITIKEDQLISSVVTSTTTTSTIVSIASTNITSTTTATNTVVSSATTTTNTNNVSSTSNSENKQIKTPIKILKNSDGRYEVLRSPPGSWNSKEQSITNIETKSSNPEFSVVSIGNGQNSNGVKITLKQCSPNNTSPNKPKVISNVLLHCGQVDKDSSEALLIQQLQRNREKRQIEKQEEQRRRVTFMERLTPEKTISTTNNTNGNTLKSIQKKPGEQQEKKQFLQSFQLTARETGSEIKLESSSNELNMKDEINDTQNKDNVTPKKEDDNATETSNNINNSKNKSNNENISVNASGNISNVSKPMSGISNNARMNTNKQCNDIDTCTFGYSKSTNPSMNISINNNPAKVDVYTFSNDPPIVPAGAVKRKCPPGLPIFDIRRKKQQIQTHISKKQTHVHPSPVMQNNTKSPRKLTTEHVISAKRPGNIIAEAGPSRTLTTSSSKPSSSPILSNDTRNILDGCGLNIPASLSITLTAPKSPGNSSGSIEPNDSKDNRKNTLGKVSPSITLNDRSVDPRVLKALKAGQIRMPAPLKPRQTKQPERDQQRQALPTKRKRDQESRDILDLSGGKKMDIHPLRIPQPVTKLKTKSTIKDIPNISDQGQIVTLGGHKYYRAPPGSLTPAPHRVNDCPIPTPLSRERSPVMWRPAESSAIRMPLMLRADLLRIRSADVGVPSR